jgi:hypothetical protein
MEQPEPSLHQLVPVTQMHPHEAVALQRAAPRAACIAPAVEPEGKKPPEPPAANRAGESGAGNDGTGCFPRELPGPVDSTGCEIRRLYATQHPVQIKQHSLYSASAPFLGQL